MSMTEDEYGYAEDDLFDDDMVSIRPEGSRAKKVLIVLGILLVMFLGLFVFVRGWISGQLDPPGEPFGSVELVIESGSTTGDIAKQLEDADVIPDSFFFQYYTRWKNQGDFQAGEYTFQENMSAEEAVVVLNGGPRSIDVVTVQIPEGLWVEETVAQLAEQLPNVTQEELQEVLDSGQLTPQYRPDGQASWEGYLFPNTYEVRADASALEVLSLMTNEFAQISGGLGYGSIRPSGLSAYEVLIVASLVEAEAKTDADRAKIARVIYNRLNDGEWLDIDATLVYEQGERGKVPDAQQIRTETPYNTRAPAGIRGLPPTPVAAPGKASMEAALNPAEGDWKFYVLADEQGNHFFTADFDEFNAQKARSREAGLL